MDLNAFDFDLDLENDSDLADLTLYRRSMTARSTAPADRTAARSTTPTATTPRAAARSLTNSPGCAPAPATPAMARVLRKVRTDAWSAPASVSWARPTRALRKVARRAVDGGMTEPA